MSGETRPIEILLVEDDPGDVRLTLDALAESKLGNTVHVVRDGVAAIEFLHRRGEYAGAPSPDLILLDLGLPKRGGLEVLAELRTIPALKDVPVLVVTASHADADLVRSDELRVDGYLIKPVDLKQLLDFVESFDDFCLEMRTMPNLSIRSAAAV